MDRLDLWQFEEIKRIGKNSTLIRNSRSGRLMVKCVCAEDRFELFERISKLSHPNLMRVFDSVVTEGQCVSVCEYIEGVTLEEFVSSQRLYSEAEVINIIAQLCDGLSVLHTCGIVHRDINPSNVMIDRNGIVKIIDYDISRRTNKLRGTDTQIMGTPGYAAPEQFGFSQTDARADIYSCGVLMNYLLTGQLPNEKLYFGNLTPFIQRCIEMDNANRYQTAAELKSAILGRRNTGTKKKQKTYLNYSRLPGFRKGIFLKILTILLMIGYAVCLFAYVNYTVNFLQDMSPPDGLKHILTGVDFFVLLSALPYLAIGDIAGVSRFIVRGNPQKGRRILVSAGVASLIAGAVLFFVLVKL